MEHPSHGLRTPAAYAGLFLLAFALLQWLIPLAKLPITWLSAANLLATVLFLGVPFAFVYQASRVQLSGWATAAVFLVSVALFAGLALWLTGRQGPWVGPLFGSGQAALLLAAGSGGMLLARAIREPNMLVPIAPVVALVDIATVMSPVGVVHQVLEKAPQVFEKVAVRVPSVGSPTPQAFMGPADVLFVAMFFSVLHRAGFRSRETLLWLIPTLVAYMLFVLLFGNYAVAGFRLSSLPALVPIAVVVLVVNWRCFDLSPSERRMTWGLIGVAAFLTALLLMYPRK